MAYTPAAGDIVWLDFDPAAGHEQNKRRPALVLSPLAFNQHVGMALMVPITSRIRHHAFEVAITGGATSGVALCHQIKSVDFVARKAKLIERASGDAVTEAQAKIRAILS